MDKAHVAIATITLARDAAEQSTLLNGLEALAAFGRPVFVTDGGSAAAFVRLARSMDGVTFVEPARRGIWPQARSSLERARTSGARHVLYTEPDKQDFFRDKLAAFVADASTEAGVVLVARSAAALATFPAFQQYTESVINRCCAEVTGTAFDYSYGPFLLASAIVDHLHAVPDDIGWGWRPFAFGIAHRLGYDVHALEKASACPTEQRGHPERGYRMQQLAESVRGIALAAKADLKEQKT